MTQHAPRGRHLELGQQGEEPIDDLGPLAQAGIAKLPGPVVAERPPDQLEVQAEREDAALQGAYRIALTTSMFDRSRQTRRSASPRSTVCQRRRKPGRRDGARRSTQLTGPR